MSLIIEGYDNKLGEVVGKNQLVEFLDKRSISKNNKITVSFHCEKCNETVSLSYNRFQYKYLKRDYVCSMCKNDSSFGDIIKRTDEEWKKIENKDKNIKKYYYVMNLTTEEYDDLKNRIIKIDREDNIADLVLIPNGWNEDSRKFGPLLINNKKKVVWIPKRVEIKCDCCENSFCQSWSYLKNKRFLFCQDCMNVNSRKI